MKNTYLKRYWIRFENISYPTPLNIGCGVTAYDYDDAIKIMKEFIFLDKDFPPITDVVENIDVSVLDPKHVIPNMGLITERGIWFPRII